MDKLSKYKNLNLYSYWRSSCSWRIRIVLEVKNIPYKITPVHLLKDGGQHLTEEFKKLNPIQRVPVLEFEHKNEKIVLVESLPIIEFLEESFPECNMLPSDPIMRAKVRAVCCEIACNIQPVQNLNVLVKVEKLGGNKTEWAKEYISKGLAAVEKLIADTKGKYCFGDNITIADAFLIPQLYNARRFDVDLTECPSLVEIENNLAELESFRKAHPDSQPDAEK